MTLTRTRIVAAAMLALAGVILAVPVGQCAGCLGKQARERVALPAVVMATDGVEEDARRGAAELPPIPRAAAEAQIDAFVAPIEAKDRRRIAAESWPLWPSVKDLALDGIAARETAGEVGPGVAASLRERVDRYDEALTKLIERIE